MKTVADDMTPMQPHDAREYDGFERVSPIGAEHTADEVIYRCPVSTPTVSRRTGVKVPHRPFVAFTSMNHSLQIPDNISTAKHAAYKMANSKTKRQTAKAQKKNFDCYFVNKIDKSVHIDAQVKSTWLNSLCSQPVDEIFGKYQRRSEASRRGVPVRISNSTPGEKALLNGWSSNASSRGSPSSMSRSTRSGPTNQVRIPVTSSVDLDLRVYGFDHDPDRSLAQPGFALMPVGSPTIYDGEDALSPRSSPLFTRVFRNNANHNNIGPLNEFVSSNTSIDSNVYEPYQRDKRFPELLPDKRFPELLPRKSTFSPTRKIITSETREERPQSATTSSMTTLDLHESPMHIVSIGNFNTNCPFEKYNTFEGVTVSKIPVPKPVSRKCSYRLPKHSLSLTLPQLKSNG